VRWISATLLGLLLLPATAGLGLTLFDYLVGLHSEPDVLPGLLLFLSGFTGWIVVFVFLNRPVRLYIFSHELAHLLAAWAGGVSGGELSVRRDGGSVRVGRVTFWIALAPYVIPLYSLATVLIFGLIPDTAVPGWFPGLLPLLLGITWSFHVTFTLFAVCQPQSDFRAYGTFGSLSVILCLNLLFLTLMAAFVHPLPFPEEVQQLLSTLWECYQWVGRELLLIKNAIIQS
jgi:hypothetical protein